MAQENIEAQDQEEVVDTLETGNEAGNTEPAGEDTQPQAETPWYAQYGEFDSKEAFDSHFSEIARKAAEAEQLANQKPERQYVSDFTKAMDNLLEVSISAGKTPEEAMTEAYKFAVEITKPWKDIAKSDPLQVLLEKECRDMPEIDRSTHERLLRSQYRIPQEPDPSDTEAHQEWEDEAKIINAKMSKEAFKAASELEAKKGSYGLSPDIAQYIENRKAMMENHSRLAPEYEATLKKVASSLEFSHNGVTVPVKVFESDGKLAKGMEFLQKEYVDFSNICDSSGKIDGDKVAKYVIGGWIGTEANVRTLMDMAAKKEGTKATREAVNGFRNPQDAPARGGAPAASNNNRVNESRQSMGLPPI